MDPLDGWKLGGVTGNGHVTILCNLILVIIHHVSQHFTLFKRRTRRGTSLQGSLAPFKPAIFHVVHGIGFEYLIQNALMDEVVNAKGCDHRMRSSVTDTVGLGDSLISKGPPMISVSELSSAPSRSKQLVLTAK